MSDSSPNAGNQAFYSIMAVIISVLIVSLFVLVFGPRLQGNSTEKTVQTVEYNSAAVNAPVQQIATRIKRDSDAIAEHIYKLEEALKSAIDAKEIAESARDGMSDQLLSYRKELEEARLNAGRNRELLSQLNSAKLDINGLRALNEKYLVELQKLRNSDIVPQLKAENRRLQSEIADLNASLRLANSTIEELRKREDSSADLRAQLIAYKRENEELRQTIAELRAKMNRLNLFVKEASSLDPRVSALYNSLVALKGKSGLALEVAYSEIQNELKVKKLRHIKFAEGSAYVSELETGLIKNDLIQTSDDSFLLVVGYASTTGSAEMNYELSAKRATSVASVVFDGIQGTQDVKAVFLGQTDRFAPNKASENQVCEIWEVYK